MNYLDELNEPQREAVMQVNGPIMIIAGAGGHAKEILVIFAEQKTTYNIFLFYDFWSIDG